ncbi:DUF6053 domain-containing protein [Lysobacter yananisis]
MGGPSGPTPFAQVAVP